MGTFHSSYIDVTVQINTGKTNKMNLRIKVFGMAEPIQ